MGKLKQGKLIPGTTRLYKQSIHHVEIAPIYIKQDHQTLIAAETDAMAQAQRAGYRAVVIETYGGRPRQSNLYLLVDGDWKQGDWRWGKWGKLSEKDPGGIFKVPPTPAPLLLAAGNPAPASPLAGSTARIEAVTPLWPEADSPEMETMARRLVELANLEPLGITVPYTLDVAGV